MPICTPLGSAFPLVLHPPVEQVLHTQWCMPALFRMHAPRIYRPSRPFLICRPTLTKALCKPYSDMPLSCRPSQPFLMCRPTQTKALRTPYSDMPLCTVAVLPTHGGSLPTRDGSMNSVVLHLFGGRPGDSVDLHLLDIWPRKGATFESTGLHSLRYHDLIGDKIRIAVHACNLRRGGSRSVIAAADPALFSL